MNPSDELKDQIKFLVSQLRKKEIDLHQYMTLLDMAYQDYLELNPEEHPYNADRQRIKESIKKIHSGNRD